MIVLRLLPVILSFLLLGAHCYRAGLPVLSGFCAGALLLLLVRSAWIPRLFRLFLVLGALEWLRSLYYFATMRIAFGEPWTRLAVILGGVALFTVLSGLVFRSKKLRRYYQESQV
jgi:hypothetical protein